MFTNKTNRKYVVKQNLNNVLSIVIGDWKYIEPSKFFKINKDCNIEMGNDNIPQLYNLKNDPGEKVNLANNNPEKVNELKTVLDKVKKQ